MTATASASIADRVRGRARLAGVLYLLLVLIGPFAFLLGRAGVAVPDDAAATAANLVSQEGMVRLGLAAESLVIVIEVVLTAVLFVLVRPVSRHLSLASAAARYGMVVVMAVNLATGLLALALAGDTAYLDAVDAADRAALASLFVEANEFLIQAWGILFGVHLVLLGHLVQRSGFLPALPGVLLMVAGAGYLAESLGTMVAPGAGGVLAVVVIVLAIPGELGFPLWLLVKGVDGERWEARARAAAADPAV